ncbi:MAG: alpha/beta hydrolase [Pseudomonadota bacterium]
MSTIDPQRTVYFHGAPGSPIELDIAGIPDRQKPVTLPPLDLRRFDQHLDQNSLKSVSLIGFSMGSFSAIKIAAARPDRVADVVLVSPAAPLELGDFLKDAKGGALFSLAKIFPPALRYLTVMQASIAAVAPLTLLRVMFAGACEAERRLLTDANFISLMTKNLRQALQAERETYLHSVSRFVQPWADDLQKVQCAVSIVHGALDSWAPLSMAKTLKRELDDRASLEVLPTAGHYSTLLARLPEILHSPIAASPSSTPIAPDRCRDAK